MPKISLITKKALKTPRKSRIVVENSPVNGAVLAENPWTPSILKPEKDWLVTENVSHIDVLAYDIDNTTKEQLSLNAAIELFKGFKCFIGTTRNHQVEKVTQGKKVYPPADRYRIILFLDRSCYSLEDYQFTFTKFAEQIKINNVVDSTSDFARFFYPCKEIIFEGPEAGALVKVLKAPEKMDQQQQQRSTAIQPTANGARGALPKNVLNFIAQVGDNNIDWFQNFSNAVFKIRKAGYSQEECEAFILKAAPYGFLTAEDKDQIDRIYSKELKDQTPITIQWPEMLPPTKNRPYAIPKPGSSPNYIHMISVVEGLNLRYNTRAACIETAPGVLFTDSDLNRLFQRLHEYNLGPKKDLLVAVIDTTSQKNKYDPLIDKLNGVKWDGTPRISKLLESLTFPADLTSADLALYELFLRRWLIGIVRRILYPGSENNMLVFVGAQGAGKTRWFRQLANIYPQGFIEAHINPDDKDCHLNLLKYFLWSVSELDTITYQKDVGALKDFITKSEVRARPAYGRFDVTGSAITSFCASVNSRDFLYDTTGNRRYLIMLVEKVNPDHGIDIQQLYAEVKAYMEAGERAWFNADEIKVVNAYNERFMSRSDILETFESRVTNGDAAMSLKEITDSLGIETVKNSDRRSIRDWMTKKGIKEVNHGNVKKYRVSIGSINKEKPAQLNNILLKNVLTTTKN